MKNRIIVTVLVILAAAFPTTARGQDPSIGKIGLVNMQGAILATAEGKKAFTDLQTKYQPRRDEIKREQEDVQALQDQIQKQSTTLSDDEQNRLEHERADKETTLKRLTEDAQNDFQYDRDTILQRIGKKMVQVIGDYAKGNGYVLVLDGGQIPVYYAAQGVDITAAIVKQYDTAYPVVASAAGASSSARDSAKPKPKP